MRILGSYAGLEAGDHVGRFLAVHAAIDYGELVPRKMPAELELEAARVGRLARARAGPVGRRRADRHDLDRLTARNAERGTAQRLIEPSLFGGHIAFWRRGGCRRARKRCWRCEWWHSRQWGGRLADARGASLRRGHC